MDTIIAVVNAAIRSAVPITFGAMSGLVSERSGIVNIAIEGMMLAGAFTAFTANVFLSLPGVPSFLQEQPIRLGLTILIAATVSGLMALLHAMLSIRYKVDQIISGTVINIFAVGITGYLYIGGQNTLGGLPAMIRNPFTPDQGVLYVIGGIAFGKGFLTYLALFLVPILGFALFRTTWGLRTRAIGENPRAADTLGVNVHRLQYTNLFLSGALAGLAGATLILEGVSFERGMSAGRGFISLAVMIFGMWRPSRAFLGALLFGFAGALQSQFQFMQVQIPHQFISMLPYVLTLIVLAGFMGRARPPAHTGTAYEVE
ncbi:MAG: ABC transporter permease [Anaerolineae bacterium]|nr:ABC transporter permease [Anaerolineae bacterium]